MRLLLIAIFLLSGLLSGCENTDSLKSTIAEQQQEIAQLKERIQAESLRAKALQEAVNQATVYEWAGPFRWLPVWSDASLHIGQEMRAEGLVPDWRAWAELAVLYAGLAGIIGASVGAGISAWRRMEQSDLLADKIRMQEITLQQGQPQLERLKKVEEQLKAAKEKLHETTLRIEKAQRRLNEAEEKACAIEEEIEEEKARALAEYRDRLEREQQASTKAAERITKALDDL